MEVKYSYKCPNCGNIEEHYPLYLNERRYERLPKCKLCNCTMNKNEVILRRRKI